MPGKRASIYVNISKRRETAVPTMGGRHSTLKEPESMPNVSDNSSAYFALAILEPDRICLIHAGADVIEIIERSIRNGAPETPNSSVPEDLLQKAFRKDDGSYEIQLRGHPFSKFAGRTTALKIKRVLCHLVADLYTRGWDLSVASDLTTNDYHTTWFFRERPLTGSPMQYHDCSTIRSKKRIISLSLSGSDGLTLINAPDRLRKALIDAVRFGYTYGTEEAEDVFDGDFEIKLNGGPWETSMLEEGIWARKLLLEIFRQFSKCNYVYYAVADTKGTADSIFFIHQPSEAESGARKSVAAVGQVEKNQQCALNVRNAIENIVHEKTVSPESKNEITAAVDSPKCSILSVSAHPRRRSSGPSNDLRPDMCISNISASSSGDHLSVASQPRRSSWQEPSNIAPITLHIPPLDQYPFQIEQFFMISLNRADSLRLIDSPKAVRDLAKVVILTHWPHGLKRETKYDMAYEFRLNRTPWASSDSDAVAARSVLTALFEKLLALGWRLLATLDISRRRNDKSVFVLRKDPNFEPGTATVQPHFCLSMTDGDKIRVIRGDDQVVRAVQKIAKEHWPHGIQKEREIFGCYEIQVIGHPWISLPGKGNEPLAARVLMLEMLRAFHDNGWRVIVSADVSGRYQTPANLLYNPVSVDSWIVAKEVTYGKSMALSGNLNGI